MSWFAYRAKHGSLDPATRIQHQIAGVQALVANALGNQAEPKDFLPEEPRRQSEAGISFQQAVAAFQTAEG